MCWIEIPFFLKNLGFFRILMFCLHVNMAFMFQLAFNTNKINTSAVCFGYHLCEIHIICTIFRNISQKINIYLLIFLINQTDYLLKTHGGHSTLSICASTIILLIFSVASCLAGFLERFATTRALGWKTDVSGIYCIIMTIFLAQGDYRLQSVSFLMFGTF